MNLFKSHISHVFLKKKVTLTLIISNRKNNMYIFEIMKVLKLPRLSFENLFLLQKKKTNKKNKKAYLMSSDR